MADQSNPPQDLPAQATEPQIKQENRTHAMNPPPPFPGMPNAGMPGLPWPVHLVPAGGVPADIVTVSDRRVRLPPATSTDPVPGMYAVCRAWVRNDPDLAPIEVRLCYTKERLYIFYVFSFCLTICAYFLQLKPLKLAVTIRRVSPCSTSYKNGTPNQHTSTCTRTITRR